MLQCRLQHERQFVFMPGGHYGHVGDVPQIRYVKHAVVRRPVLSHQACPVQAENYRQVLQADIVNNLVVGAL